MKRDPAKFQTPVEYETILNYRGNARPGRRVKYYDFCRPDKFSRDQIRTVQIIHETFARLSTTSLSAQLRSLVHVHVTGVDQCTYEEFVRSIPNPAFLSIINLDPLRGSAVLEMDLPLTFAIVERLFGGQARDSGLNRDLTDIEAMVLEEIVMRLLGNLRDSWSTVLDLRPRLGSIETNPMFAQIVPPTEMVIVVTLEGMIENVKGRVNLCIPYLTIEPIISKLSAQYWYSSVRRGKGEAARDVSGLKARAEVLFEASRLSLSDVFRLKKGALVKLDDAATAYLTVGRAAVLRFAVKKEKGAYRFEAAAGASAAADEAVAAGGGQKAEAEKLELAVKAPLEALSREMSAALEKICGQVAELQKRQEELGDQLFQSGREGGGERAPETAGEGRPFSFVGADDPDGLYNVIQLEHPQTIALVLSFLEPGLAAGVLTRFPDETQADLAERIALIERCSPEVIREVESVLKKKLSLSNRNRAFLQESDAIIGILNVAGRKLENNIVGRLEKTNPELAEQIKRKLFVFEDTVLLDDGAIRKLIPRVDPADLLLALKAVNEKTKEKFLKNMKPEAQKKFAEDSQFVGPVRLVDADKAQQRIIATIRQMEEAGEIVVAHPDELVAP
jgi:flagellar motor switch protein FliM